MSEVAKSNGKPDQAQLQGLVQCDLATNLFAVFIAILAALQIIAIVLTTSGFKLRVTPERQDTERPLGLVRSWHPVLPINKKVLIRNDRAIGLNLTPVAMGIETGVKQFAGNSDVTDQSRARISDRAPSAFVLMLHMDADAKFPEQLETWSMDIGADEALQPTEEIQAWIDQALSVDIYVSIGQEENAWQMAAYLSKLNIPLRIQKLTSKTAFSFSRRTKYFGFEGVYK